MLSEIAKGHICTHFFTDSLAVLLDSCSEINFMQSLHKICHKFFMFAQIFLGNIYYKSFGPIYLG